MCVCCTEDKKGGVDRSSTVIAKEPEGKTNNKQKDFICHPTNNYTYQCNTSRLLTPNVLEHV